MLVNPQAIHVYTDNWPGFHLCLVGTFVPWFALGYFYIGSTEDLAPTL